MQAPIAPQRIHYGSLEEQERAERVIKSTQHTIKKLERSGLVLENLTQVKQQTTHEQQAILDDYEKKKELKNIIVPTDDAQVRRGLKIRAEPQCLFGEGPAERRDRLRALLSDLQKEGLDLAFDEELDDQDEDDDNEEFYSYGPDELQPCRQEITRFSLPRAKARLEKAQTQKSIPPATQKNVLGSLYSRLREYDISASQFGDTRPLCAIRFSPCSKLVATGSFSGPVHLWNSEGAGERCVFKGHRSRTTSIDFHPNFTNDCLNESSGGIDLVSCGIDGTVLAWNANSSESPVAQFVGHDDVRVSRVAFHPTGEYIATASFDQTWRLWDTTTQTEILCQEGHSRELFALGFQCDGSLVCTGGKDGIGRVWDLRSGRSVVILQGHVKGILDMDWSPNGYQLASASEDHTVRIWDIRGKGSGCIANIPAHTNLVSSVRYFNAASDFSMKDKTAMDVDQDDTSRDICSGSFLVSSAYDGTCKIWTAGDFKPIKTFTGMDNKVMACDVSRDAKYIATAAYDRTFKIYGKE